VTWPGQVGTSLQVIAMHVFAPSQVVNPGQVDVLGQVSVPLHV
jgi:hypothetical protein